jgi:hypothetical protein
MSSPLCSPTTYYFNDGKICSTSEFKAISEELFSNALLLDTRDTIRYLGGSYPHFLLISEPGINIFLQGPKLILLIVILFNIVDQNWAFYFCVMKIANGTFSYSIFWMHLPMSSIGICAQINSLVQLILKRSLLYAWESILVEQ